MRFFDVKGMISVTECEDENKREVIKDRSEEIFDRSAQFNLRQKNPDKAYFFVVDISAPRIRIGIISNSLKNPSKQLESYFKCIKLEIKDVCIEETTFTATQAMLCEADENCFINDDEEVLEHFGLQRMNRILQYNYDVKYHEDIIEDAAREDIYRDAEKLVADNTLNPELDRIYSGKVNKNMIGHPVHYLVESDDKGILKGMYRCLLQALNSNNRIQSRRYVTLDVRPDEDLSMDEIKALYKNSVGGTIALRFHVKNRNVDGDEAVKHSLKVLCNAIKDYRNEVLTIFCLPCGCDEVRKTLYRNMGSVYFVAIRETAISGEEAVQYLKNLARKRGVRADKKLYSLVDDGVSYLAPELREKFGAWFDNKLRTDVYSQYKDIFPEECGKTDETCNNSAYNELMEMVGLASAKEVINQTIDYYKARKLFADKGLKDYRPVMHMAFTGNPGTAKTTVARLFARIMKEKGLISNGKLVEVGRGDLVGQYIGWTAPLVRNKFHEAKGGVLFIDEAYALVDDRDNSYGDECITAITQEMENHKDDVVVIFAGYPDKMEEFLNKNPGLRSRIAFHVGFEDYTTEELCEIARLMAHNRGFEFTEDACKKMKDVFEVVRKSSDFGNGRFVRNLLEKALMAQSTRLVAMDYDAVTTKDLMTICGNDIAKPVLASSKPARPIGFCA